MYILSTLKIRDFAEEVLRLPVSMMTGELDPDQVKVLLGELLDVWPASIFPGLGEPDEEQDDDSLEAALAELDRMPESEWRRLGGRPT